jgi:HlyD family secretion protein
VGAGLFTRGRMVPLALGLLALLLALLILHDVFFPPSASQTAVSTTAVATGTVRSAVTGTGTVVPAQQQNVGFGEAGTLAEVDVKVGDHVTKGQTLARLDTTILQQALQTAQNGETQAQATLNTTANGNGVVQAQHGLSSAQQSLSDTQAQVNLTNQQDQATLSSDKSQLDQDTNALNAFLATHPGACATTPLPTQCAAVNADNTKISADNNKIAVDQLAGQRSINQANNAVTTAQDSLNSQTISRPNTIASQQAALSNAQLQVQTAQRNLDMATLTAPFDGVVQSLSGVPGESASAGGGATAQSPGSIAPQPSSSGATSAAASGSGTGSAFMVLSSASGLQVIAPFAETDASRLAPNQTATITFDAVSNLTVTAHVLAVANNATVISNVTNYYATLVVDQLDPRLKSGMTANATVVVQNAAGVLTLPNSVITRIGNAAFVTLLSRDGKTQTRQAIQTGTVGDTTTEITGGLNAGDRVVRPQLRTGTGAAGAAGGRAGGAGGLGGGAVRGLGG